MGTAANCLAKADQFRRRARTPPPASGTNPGGLPPLPPGVVRAITPAVPTT